MRRYDTVIFDLDGTLLDTLGDLADSTNFALEHNGFPVRTRSEVRAFVGNGVGNLIKRAVPDGTPQEMVERCLADFRAYYLSHMQNRTAPYPGITGLLNELQQQGYRLAVVSNKFDGAVKALCGTYFGSLLPVALGERPGLPKKPAPDLVFRCMERLGAAPDRTVYVGDSDVDLQTAQNASLPCLSVSWGFRDAAFLLEHGAREIVATPEELLRALSYDTPSP